MILPVPHHARFRDQATAPAKDGSAERIHVNSNNGAGFVPLSNSSIYSGVTTTTLTISGASTALNNDQYEAVFTNAGGSVTTTAATFTVDDVVTTQPTNLTVDAGQGASFTALSAYATDSVQWQVSTDGVHFTALSNGPVYGGVTTTTLTISGTTSALNNDYYEAVFTPLSGTPTSTPDATPASNLALLTVNDVITSQPSNQTISFGQIAAFTAASAYATDTVQWQVSTDDGQTFADIASATSPTLTFATSANQNGYEYRAVFTPLTGTPSSSNPLTSNAAVLTVDSVITQPTDQTFNAGQTVTFTAQSLLPGDQVLWNLSSDGGFSYAPLSNGGQYSGVTTNSLTITGATADMASNEYEAVFSNATGSLTSFPAALISSANAVINTTTTFASSGPSLSFVDQPVTYTVTVTPASRQPISNQTIDIEDASNGNAIVATPTLTNGSATFSLGSLALGTHQLFAFFPANGSYSSSRSGTFLTQQVSATPTITLTSSSTTSALGASVTFTATVGAANGTPTGYATFRYTSPSTISPISLGTEIVTNGVATLSTTSLAIGTYTITAVYSGNATYASVQATPVTQVITPRKTLVVLVGDVSANSNIDSWETDAAAQILGQLDQYTAGNAVYYVAWNSLFSNEGPTSEVAQYIASFLQTNGGVWNLLFVGDGRGGIFVDKTLDKLNQVLAGQTYRVGYAEQILLDPTALTPPPMSDYFPTGTPVLASKTLDYSDDLDLLNGLLDLIPYYGEVRDFINILGNTVPVAAFKEFQNFIAQYDSLSLDASKSTTETNFHIGTFYDEEDNLLNWDPELELSDPDNVVSAFNYFNKVNESIDDVSTAADWADDSPLLEYLLSPALSVADWVEDNGGGILDPNQAWF